MSFFHIIKKSRKEIFMTNIKKDVLFSAKKSVLKKAEKRILHMQMILTKTLIFVFWKMTAQKVNCTREK